MEVQVSTRSFLINFCVLEPPLKLSNAKKGTMGRPKRLNVAGSRSKEPVGHGARSSSNGAPGSQNAINKLFNERGQGIRQSSASNIKPKVQLIPNDKATNNLANLKRVKFLDPAMEAPVRQDAATVSAEFQKRKQQLDSSLQRIVDKTRVAHMEVTKKSKEAIEAEKKARADELASNPLAKLLDTGK